MALTFDPTRHFLEVGQEFQSGLGQADWGGNFPTEYMQKQVDEIWNEGWRHVIVAAPGQTNFTYTTTVGIHLQIIELFLAKGFDVDWGVVPAAVTFAGIDDWLNVYPFIEAYDSFKSLVDQYGSTGSRWIIGNECEASYHRGSQTIPTFVRSSNVATVTTSRPHNLAVGDRTTIDGVYNSVIEIIDEYNFRQTNAGSDVTKNNISITLAETLAARIISRAAQYVKTERPTDTLPLIYRCFQGSFNAGLNYNWELFQNTGVYPANDYLSSIDKVCLNIYGEGSTPTAAWTDFQATVNKMVTVYGAENVEITEFGLRGDDNSPSNVPRNSQDTFNLFKQRVDFMDGLGSTFHLFSRVFPHSAARSHLSLTHPPRYQTATAYTKIYDYVLGRSQNSIQKFAHNGTGYEFRLTNIHQAREGLNKIWEGSLYNENDGDARNLTSGYNFSKSDSYAWCFWAKMANVGADKANTIIRFGNGGVNGYRISIERNTGVNYFVFQEFTSYTSLRFIIPSYIDIGDWNHYAITWDGQGSGAYLEAYVNGRLVKSTSGNVTWSNLVELSNVPISIGYEYNVETTYGYVSDLMYFEKLISADEVWAAMNQRSAIGASSYWPLDDDSETTAVDLIGGVDLTLNLSTTFALEAPVLVEEPNYQIVDSAIGFNFGRDAQSAYYNSVQNQEDLERLWNMGVRTLRIGSGDPAFSEIVDAVHNTLTDAYDYGFNIIYTVQQTSGFAMTDALWAGGHTDNVVEEVEWLVANSMADVDVCIANEIGYAATKDTPTITDPIDKIQALATVVKAISGFTGEVHASIAQSSLDYDGAPDGWIANSVAVLASDIDKLGYQPYGDAGLTTAQAKQQVIDRTQDLYDTFGAMLYISEWSVPRAAPARPSTESEMASMLSDELTAFLNMGITLILPFTYRWGKPNGTAEGDLWAVRVGRTTRDRILGFTTIVS